MKNYLKNNLDSYQYHFPYLGFILDEAGVEHDFGTIIPNSKADDMHNNLVAITSKLANHGFITYLNLSGEEIVSDGALQVGQSPTLKQRAALREYHHFFQQHMIFPIHHFFEEHNYETYYLDIDEFLDFLYEEEYTRCR